MGTSHWIMTSHGLVYVTDLTLGQGILLSLGCLAASAVGLAIMLRIMKGGLR